MEMTADKFRGEAMRRRGDRRRGAAPYSAEQRAFAVAYARSGLSEGRSVAASAAALGISDPSLREWLTRAPASAGTSLRSVVVKAPPSAAPTTALTLISPSGYRVGGLDVMTAAALLRVVG